MRYCFNCGKELGFYSDYDPLDHCGKFQCHQAAYRKRRELEEEDPWGGADEQRFFKDPLDRSASARSSTDHFACHCAVQPPSTGNVVALR